MPVKQQELFELKLQSDSLF